MAGEGRAEDVHPYLPLLDFQTPVVLSKQSPTGTALPELQPVPSGFRSLLCHTPPQQVQRDDEDGLAAAHAGQTCRPAGTSLLVAWGFPLLLQGWTRR